MVTNVAAKDLGKATAIANKLPPAQRDQFSNSKPAVSSAIVTKAATVSPAAAGRCSPQP